MAKTRAKNNHNFSNVISNPNKRYLHNLYLYLSYSFECSKLNDSHIFGDSLKKYSFINRNGKRNVIE